MTITVPVIGTEAPDIGRYRAPGPRRQPRSRHGEKQFERLLRRRGERPEFEPWIYPLRSGYTMRPDFYLPETSDHPEFHFEITFLDAAIVRLTQELERRPRADLERELTTLTRRWMYKQRKAAEVREQHGIEVVLVPYSLWRAVMIRPGLLEDLIPRHRLEPSVRKSVTLKLA
jgi:hypothetical protein